MCSQKAHASFTWTPPHSQSRQVGYMYIACCAQVYTKFSQSGALQTHLLTHNYTNAISVKTYSMTPANCVNTSTLTKQTGEVGWATCTLRVVHRWWVLVGVELKTDGQDDEDFFCYSTLLNFQAIFFKHYQNSNFHGRHTPT